MKLRQTYVVFAQSPNCVVFGSTDYSTLKHNLFPIETESRFNLNSAFLSFYCRRSKESSPTELCLSPAPHTFSYIWHADSLREFERHQGTPHPFAILSVDPLPSFADFGSTSHWQITRVRWNSHSLPIEFAFVVSLHFVYWIANSSIGFHFFPFFREEAATITIDLCYF